MIVFVLCVYARYILLFWNLVRGFFFVIWQARVKNKIELQHTEK